MTGVLALVSALVSAIVSAPRLVHLSTIDLVIVVFYFVLVLAIGFYLKSRSNTAEDFFLAGREMRRPTQLISLSHLLGVFPRTGEVRESGITSQSL